jgi:Ca2+-binding RTX toxin-like protein
MGEGNEILFSNASNQTLKGGQGNDTLFANGSNTILVGGFGDDILFSNNDGNTSFGGPGRDRFVLSLGPGQNNVQDFEDGQDLLIIPLSLNFNSFNSPGITPAFTFEQLTLEQQGQNTVISLADDVLAVLSGIQTSQITADDFTTPPVTVI